MKTIKDKELLEINFYYHYAGPFKLIFGDDKMQTKSKDGLNCFAKRFLNTI